MNRIEERVILSQSSAECDSIEPITTTALVYDFPATATKQSNRFAYHFAKRVMDILCSAIALVLLSPLFLLVAIMIKLDSKGPVFFKQVRVGKDEKRFTMYKFRSMFIDAEARLKDLQDLNERDGPVFKIHNDPRVTKVGNFIRKTCIDELPQLINILKGDMCIVGPRPPLPNEVEQYAPYHMGRLSVTQGLTCYWQISDRDMTFDEWVESDIRYINERSLPLDIKIIFKTMLVVFRQLGAK
ncbi:MAG: sugar transferase [Oscillospiraceae bacterium]|nr:sugar transferase [Oscillospiraceae bacterium]